MTFTQLTQDTDNLSAYIFDIDWTIAQMNSRSPHDYSKVSKDLPINEVIGMLETLSEWYEIVFVTERPESCRKDTEKWINDELGSYQEFPVYMRKEWDKREDTIIKREALEEIMKEYNVRWAFEDRSRCVKMYRESWIFCYQVAEGNF